jgi:hypothetical protein
MATSCSEFDRWLAAGAAPETGAAASADWERHLAGCASCQAQWSAHHALRSALRGTPPPEELGPQFVRSLMARLERQSEAVLLRPRSRAARWGLRLYWLATAVLSAGIVAEIDWRQALGASPWLLPLLLCPLLASPLLLLLDLEGLARLVGRAGTAAKGSEPRQAAF